MKRKFENDWDDFSQRLPNRDVALVVENRLFWISRGALADYSPLLSKMLYAENVESMSRVSLPDKKADDILELLRVLFPTNDSKKKIDYDNVVILSKLADEYKIAYLQRRCEKFLNSMTEKQNDVIKIFKDGVLRGQSKIVRYALPLLARFDLGSQELQSYLTDLPNQVHFAVLYQNRRQGAFHQFVDNRCTICDSIFDETNKSGRCLKCRSCGKSTILELDRELSTQICCRCIDPLASAHLQKVGL